jgi:hypothetical protein
VRLFLSTAEEDSPPLISAITAFDQTMSGRNYGKFDKKFRTIPEEGHGASKPAAFSRGIRHAFTGYEQEWI